MMKQFSIVNGYLCVLDTGRYDAFYGFRRTITKLYDTEWN